jgi:hypothetical protein
MPEPIHNPVNGEREIASSENDAGGDALPVDSQSIADRKHSGRECGGNRYSNHDPDERNAQSDRPAASIGGFLTREATLPRRSRKVTYGRNAPENHASAGFATGSLRNAATTMNECSVME